MAIGIEPLDRRGMVHGIRYAINSVAVSEKQWAMDSLKYALRCANAIGDAHAKASIFRMMNWLRVADLTNIDNSGEAPC